MTETIQQLKEDIAILQEKLRVLEEKEPDMMLLRQGKVDFVDYDGKDGKKYIRIEYTDSFAGEYSWYVRRVGEDAIRPVRDVNVYALLEELYQKEVVKQKDDYPYKKYTPEETEKSFREAFVKAQQTEKWKETQKLIDGPWMDDLIEKIKKDPPPFLRFELGSTLEDRIYKWWNTCFVHHPEWSMEECVEDLLDIIELFLPREGSTAGSQDTYACIAVDAENDLLKKIKSKLRNKKDT